MRVLTSLVRTTRRAWSSSFSSTPDTTASLLVINAGSSTLKYKLFALNNGSGCATKGTSCKNGGNCHKKHGDGVGAPIFSGVVELSNASSVNGRLVHRCEATHEKIEVRMPLETHRVALEEVVRHFFGDQTEGIQAIGHRVVHGGEAFHDASLITPQVIDALAANIALAPLHNPANLLGIDVATEVFGSTIPQVGVFDTAYHATMPPKAYTYAVPYSLYEQHGVRRYGFHGTSHQYVALQAAKHLRKSLETTSLITCHLGNGSSMAAIRRGQCIDTTMGMTPLEGLCMGTRSGDIDPALHYFLASHLNMNIHEIDTMLNKESGLQGICGDSDIRNIQDRIRMGEERAELAMDVYCHRVRKYLGAYLLELEGAVDALVFTAGIGENSAMVRSRVCQNLGFFGIDIDEAKNQQSTLGAGPIEIQTSKSTIKVMVIPTDEERSIAEQTYAIAVQ